MFSFLFFLEEKIETSILLDEVWKLEVSACEKKENGDTDLIETDDTTSHSEYNDSSRHISTTNAVETSHSMCSEQITLIEEQMAKLKEENQILKTNLTCKVCLDATVGDLFLPCRHLVCCVDCSSSVSKCPVCRERIVGTIKVFVQKQI